jgi:nucleotide-binding universal stress UspA family protein
LAHLDGTAEDEIRLRYAEAIAAIFGARLTGIFTNGLPDFASYGSPPGAMASVELEQRLKEDGETVHRRLADRFNQLGVANELRKIEETPVKLRRAVTTEARCADLFVASCPRGVGLGKWARLIEEVLFEGGHGLVLLPEHCKSREAIETVIIGWINTREAARAVAEALPLLRLATSARIVCAEEPAAPARRMMGLADIAAHLDRQGVRVSFNGVLSAQGDAATIILEEAHRFSADLIVTGGYGHSRLREWILGGVTRHLINQSDVPLFMAH